MDRIGGFFAEREKLNELVSKRANLLTKRFFALDNDAYEEGILPRKVKELMGLVASLVLRCDDCVTYHLARAKEMGATEEEIVEAMGIALVVGGSIVIPHLRRAYALLEELSGEHG
jgi:ribonuclease HI